jgi:hypothetical protein
MSFKRLLASSLLSVAVLILVASTAVAQTPTYEYQGNNFFLPQLPYTSAMSMHISVTLAMPLGANLVGFDAFSSINSFAASDGQRVITEADDLASGAEFVVTTDANGAITAWSWQSRLDLAGEIFYTCSGPGSGGSSACAQGFIPDDRTVVWGGGAARAANNPGTWELTNVPEPSSALLIAMGLAGLGWKGRAERARTDAA